MVVVEMVLRKKTRENRNHASDGAIKLPTNKKLRKHNSDAAICWILAHVANHSGKPFFSRVVVSRHPDCLSRKKDSVTLQKQIVVSRLK